MINNASDQWFQVVAAAAPVYMFEQLLINMLVYFDQWPGLAV